MKSLIETMKSLCRRVHQEDWVQGWEFDLWKCSVGKASIDKIGYGDLASLLSLSRADGGWWTFSSGEYIFVTHKEWASIVNK